MLTRAVVRFALVVFVAVPLLSVIADARRLHLGAPDPNAVLRITGYSYGTVWRYNQTYPPQTVNGDGWATTWDRLGRIVSISNDSSDWNGSGIPHNAMANLLTNTKMDATTVGSTLNPMTAWVGGGPPSGDHKWNGLISVKGVLYGILTWFTHPGSYYSTIIKSVDDGAHFTPVPPGSGPYTSPMFPIPDNMPYEFIQYGQDYTGTGVDNSDKYVYAIVSLYPGRTRFISALGRVPYGDTPSCASGLPDICRQNPADWSFWTGDSNGLNWSSTITDGAEIPNNSATTNAFIDNMQYLPRYRQYVSIAAAYPDPTNAQSTWYVQACDHPWGPCNQIQGGRHWNPEGLYLPSIAPHSLVNGGQQFVIMTAGDYDDCCAMTNTNRYTLTMVPATLTP
jgi:hypothetical protein